MKTIKTMKLRLSCQLHAFEHPSTQVVGVPSSIQLLPSP